MCVPFHRANTSIPPTSGDRATESLAVQESIWEKLVVENRLLSIILEIQIYCIIFSAFEFGFSANK